MRKIDILFFYEHKARELDVLCVLKYFLQTKYNLSVEIIQWQGGGEWALKKLLPDVVVLPFCYHEQAHNSCYLEWRSSKYFTLSWEELFYPGNIKAKSPRGEFPLNNVIHHAWGAFYMEFLKRLGVPEKNVFLNGNPTFMLYREPYCNYYKKKDQLAVQYGLDSSKKWVFFPENYNWAFYSDYTLKRFIDSGQSSNEVLLMKEFCYNSLKEVLKWCVDIINIGNVEIILRPRPLTLLKHFKNVVEKILGDIPDRLHIIQNESVRDWVLSSDIVFSSHSTTLIEAAVADKPVFILEPYPIPETLQVNWHKFLPHLKSYEDFFSVVKNGFFKKNDQRLKDWALGSMLSNSDPLLNLSEFLFKYKNGDVLCPPLYTRRSVTRPSNNKFLFWVPRSMLFEFRKIKRRIKRIIFPQISIDPDYIKDQVTKDEMEYRIKRWGSIL